MINIIPNYHPIFVHFTVAMLIVAAAIHLLSHFMPNSELRNQLTVVARWNLWIGVVFTLITVAAGWYAYNTVSHDAPSHIAMAEHRNWAMATLALFLGVAGWEYSLYRHGKNKGWLFTGLLAIAAALLLSTAWHGGELVYRYGLGVMALPAAEGQGHDHHHEHGDDHDHSAMHMQEEGADGHDDVGGEHMHEATPEPNIPAASGVGIMPKKAGHTHASGTPPHKD